MAFWDKVKGVANDAMNTLSDAAKDVTESAKEMNEKSKINRAIKVEEGKINNLYMVMGEKIFNENSSAPAALKYLVSPVLAFIITNPILDESSITEVTPV